MGLLDTVFLSIVKVKGMLDIISFPLLKIIRVFDTVFLSVVDVGVLGNIRFCLCRNMAVLDTVLLAMVKVTGVLEAVFL